MAYFTHHFETVITRHPVGRSHYVVIYLPDDLVPSLPFATSARLRVEADVSGVPVKGAWQPAGGRWYLMLPRPALKAAGLAIGAPVEVAFKLAPPDEVELPPELEALLAAERKVQQAWQAFTPGKQRGLAYLIASAKRPDTRAARLAQVRGVILGELPEPWHRAKAPAKRGTTQPARAPRTRGR